MDRSQDGNARRTAAQRRRRKRACRCAAHAAHSPPSPASAAMDCRAAPPRFLRRGAPAALAAAAAAAAAAASAPLATRARAPSRPTALRHPRTGYRRARHHQSAERPPPAPGRGRCVSIFLGKNRRHICTSQSKPPPKRTQRPPHRLPRPACVRAAAGCAPILRGPAALRSWILGPRRCASGVGWSTGVIQPGRQPRAAQLPIDAPCTRCLRHGHPMHAQEQLTHPMMLPFARWGLCAAAADGCRRRPPSPPPSAPPDASLAAAAPLSFPLACASTPSRSADTSCSRSSIVAPSTSVSTWWC
jgi:hypothetical protein